ncbi:MAG: helix-turn-helix transcriptional regulator [Candidatus Woesearchaeota archaeon]
MISKKNQGYALLIVALVLFASGLMLNNYHQESSLFMCTLVEQNPDIDMADCPAHSNTHIYYIAIIMAIGFGAFFFAIYLIFDADMLKSKKADKKINLDDDEKIVINLLETNEGSVYQSDIVKHTEFSKVKTTRVLDKLEGKGLLERKRRGMTNIVILKK